MKIFRKAEVNETNIISPQIRQDLLNTGAWNDQEIDELSRHINWLLTKNIKHSDKTVLDNFIQNFLKRQVEMAKKYHAKQSLRQIKDQIGDKIFSMEKYHAPAHPDWYESDRYWDDVESDWIIVVNENKGGEPKKIPANYDKVEEIRRKLIDSPYWIQNGDAPYLLYEFHNSNTEGDYPSIAFIRKDDDQLGRSDDPDGDAEYQEEMFDLRNYDGQYWAD